LRVNKVYAGKAFSWAGVQPGDLVKGVGQTKIESLNDFRRSVRRAYVEKQQSPSRSNAAAKPSPAPDLLNQYGPGSDQPETLGFFWKCSGK